MLRVRVGVECVWSALVLPHFLPIKKSEHSPLGALGGGTGRGGNPPVRSPGQSLATLKLAASGPELSESERPKPTHAPTKRADKQ